MEALGARIGARKVERAHGTAGLRHARRDSTLRRLLALGDTLAVSLALVLSFISPGNHLTFSHDLPWGLAAIPLFILIFKVYGLYDRDVKRISHSTVDDLPWLFHALLVGCLLLWLYSKESPMHSLDLLSLIVFSLLVLVFVLLFRATVRRAASQVLGAEPALLIGGGDMAGVLVDKLRAHPEYRLDIVGTLAHSPTTTGDASGGEAIRGLMPLGAINALETIAASRGIGRIVLSPRGINEQELADLLRRCRKLALKVTILPALSDALGATVEVDDVEGVTVLGINPPWLPPSSRALKRGMDIVVAGSMLIVAAPLMALVAILIKLDSPGPIFFAQERIGKAGRPFRLFKLRTMYRDAEEQRAKLLAQSSDVNWLKLDHDPRITRLGRRLRRLSLDELPQLWNVVRGEMSLVGPRPLIEAEDRLVEGWARGRLDLTPGITGYWQVLGRTRIPFAEMVKLDYLYVTNWSLWEDMRLILRTLPIVLNGRGAN